MLLGYVGMVFFGWLRMAIVSEKPPGVYWQIQETCFNIFW
jgi:hypothetical protein